MAGNPSPTRTCSVDLQRRLGKRGASRGDVDRHGTPRARLRIQLHAAAEALRPLPHARDSIAAGPPRWFFGRLQSPAVVFDGERDLPVHDLQLDFDGRTAG